METKLMKEKTEDYYALKVFAIGDADKTATQVETAVEKDSVVAVNVLLD